MTITSLQEIQSNFHSELEHASHAQGSSLPFILNPLPAKPLVANDEIFQVMTIGGSVYRRAMLKKTHNGLEILTLNYGNQPQFVTEDDLLAFLDIHIDTHIKHLAVNFAYPITPIFDNGKLDGILINGTKENQFFGLTNKKVGCEIEKYIKEKRNQEISVSIANDTVCLILSGLTQTTWDHLAAGIVGTGVNFALFLDKETVVNLESGAFTGFQPTPTGQAVDAFSKNPGKQLFEKEVSGAYLYQHFNHLVNTKAIDHPQLRETADLSYVAQKNIPQVSAIAKEHMRRSAAFVATQIAGIASFKKQPLTFIMQGSLFWKGRDYKETVEEYVKHLLPDFKINFIDVANSDILGAAKLIA